MSGYGGPRFCVVCSHPLAFRFVEEEGHNRHICDTCGHIHYLNPAPVAGTIPSRDGKVWLLRRGIEPRRGFWTFPAGFMEMGESAPDAATRETREELNLEVRLRGLVGVYSYSTGTSVHIVYAADALTEPSAGPETLDYAAFLPEEIPWDDLAFQSTVEALQDWLSTSGA